MKLSKGVRSGELNLAITGIVLLAFMTVHLLQFRFGDTEDFFLRPPPYLIYFAGIMQLQLFWTSDTSVKAVPVRDIYKLEFDRFLPADPQGFPVWSAVYIGATVFFFLHACWGWQKVVKGPLGIPELHQPRVKNLGYIIFAVLALIYISFPVYVMLLGKVGCGAGEDAAGHNLNTPDWYAHCVA